MLESRVFWGVAIEVEVLLDVYGLMVDICDDLSILDFYEHV